MKGSLSHCRKHENLDLLAEAVCILSKLMSIAYLHPWAYGIITLDISRVGSSDGDPAETGEDVLSVGCPRGGNQALSAP